MGVPTPERQSVLNPYDQKSNQALTSDWVPTLRRVESDGAAAGVASLCDIVERNLEGVGVNLQRSKRGAVSMRCGWIRVRGVRTEGLMNPTGDLKAAMRASLMSVMMDPITGEEAEVPNTRMNSPSTL